MSDYVHIGLKGLSTGRSDRVYMGISDRVDLTGPPSTGMDDRVEYEYVCQNRSDRKLVCLPE